VTIDRSGHTPVDYTAGVTDRQTDCRVYNFTAGYCRHHRDGRPSSSCSVPVGDTSIVTAQSSVVGTPCHTLLIPGLKRSGTQRQATSKNSLLLRTPWNWMTIHGFNWVGLIGHCRETARRDASLRQFSPQGWYTVTIIRKKLSWLLAPSETATVKCCKRKWVNGEGKWGAHVDNGRWTDTWVNAFWSSK